MDIHKDSGVPVARASNTLENRAALYPLPTALLGHFVPALLLEEGDLVPISSKTSAAGASFPDVDAGLEGVARPLWGLVPLAEGGGSFEHWDAMRDGLANGTDPSHPEYWGPATDYSQKVVEMAPIAYGVAAVPDHLWVPFSDGERERIVTWLRTVNDVELPDNNWRFFRVFVNHALRRSARRTTRSS